MNTLSNMSTIYEMTDKYFVFEDKNQYHVIPKWGMKREERRPVFSGTFEECEAFMEQHPYGITKKQAQDFWN